MKKQAAFIAAAVILICQGRAPAASAVVGVNMNLFTGSYQGSRRQSSSLPVLPVPALTLKVPFSQFNFSVEDVPPIGPVSYGNGFGGMQSTKLAYFTSQLAWHTPKNRFEFGAGTTLINQITFYNSFILDQSSRVAGFRMSLRVRMEQSAHGFSDLILATSPAMHGVQNTDFNFRCAPMVPCSSSSTDPEAASLVDVTAQRTQTLGALALLYGVRYLNYVAHFTATGGPADHDVGLMPFVGFTFGLGH